MTRFASLFQPIRIGGVEVPNRVVLPAHGPRLAGERYDRYLEERVQHGLGMVIVGGLDLHGAGTARPAVATWTEPDSPNPDPTTPEGKAELDRILIPQMRRHVAMARRHGTVIFKQLVHSGSYYSSPDHLPPMAASDIPDEMRGETPHQLTEIEISRFVSAYADAAVRAREVGMDGVEIHACHGLLLNSFLSPITNRRTDRYGGSQENRMRFLREILEAVQAAAGADFPIGVRLPGDEGVPGGANVTDITAITLALEPMLSYVSVAGASESGRKGGVTTPAVMSADFREGTYQDSSAAIKAALSIPVILTGRVTTPDAAERLVREGRTDLIGMVRAMIADPSWLSRVREDDVSNLRICTGDNEGCRQRTQMRTRGGGMAIACTVNAAAGREAEFDITPTETPGRVLVIGGGPGGMEAARVARLRGHEVVLLERGSELGGQLLIASKDPRGANLLEPVRYLTTQMEHLGVDVRLGTEADAATVKDAQAVAVIVATGARPRPPRFTVTGGASVVTAFEVLSERASVGDRVCVVAGFDGHRGPGTLSELLAEQGSEVHLLTERMFVGEAQDPGANHHMQKRLLEKGVTLSPLTAVTAVDGTTVRVAHALTGRESTVDGIDTVVVVERAADDNLLIELQRAGVANLMGVGDCIAPRRVLNAILEGSRAGLAA